MVSWEPDDWGAYNCIIVKFSLTLRVESQYRHFELTWVLVEEFILLEYFKLLTKEKEEEAKFQTWAT